MKTISNICKHTPGAIKDSQSGFTLVELIVVMGVLSVMLITLTDMFVSISAVETETRSVSSVSADGRYVLAKLSNDIRSSDAVVTPADYGVEEQTLILEVDGELHTYELENGTLSLTTPEGVFSLNSSETVMSGFTVSKLGDEFGADTVRLGLTLTSVASSSQGQEERTYNTAVGVR